jgi:hypothetical protein
MRRRAVLAALPATLPGVAGAQQTRIWTVGTARMEAAEPSCWTWWRGMGGQRARGG